MPNKILIFYQSLRAHPKSPERSTRGRGAPLRHGRPRPAPQPILQRDVVADLVQIGGTRSTAAPASRPVETCLCALYSWIGQHTRQSFAGHDTSAYPVTRPGGEGLITDRQSNEAEAQDTTGQRRHLSERSVRNWSKGPPSEKKKDRRRQRTRPDPLAGVWEHGRCFVRTSSVRRLLGRTPGQVRASQRTLQRRMMARAARPYREVYFAQEHPPGREADGLHGGELGVTIAESRSTLFQFLSHSGWRYARVCFSETFSALVSGLQGALWELSAVPMVRQPVGCDARPAREQGSRLQRELPGHTGPLRTEGDAHQPAQCARTELQTRTPPSEGRHSAGAHPQGSADFESVDVYTAFVRRIVDRRS